MEAGEDPLPMTRDTIAITDRGSSVTLECWSATRNLVRRVRAMTHQRRGMLELEIERFGGRTGKLTLLDLADPSNRNAGQRGSRLKYRERFRQSLRRQFPDWRIVELSTEPDLHHSLSPSFPRALLRKGTTGIAAIGAGEDALAPENALSFGLIWLDYLRRREPKLSIETLAIFVPLGSGILDVSSHPISGFQRRAIPGLRARARIHRGSHRSRRLHQFPYASRSVSPAVGGRAA